MTRPHHSNRAPGARGRRRGSALLAVVPLAILVLSLMVAFVGTTMETSRATVSQQASLRARAAAANAASLAITALWGQFQGASGGSEQLWTLRTHLDGLGIVDQANAPVREGTPFGDQLGLPRGDDGRLQVDGIEIERLDVSRVDRWDATDIFLEIDVVARRGVDGAATERRVSVQEVFTIAPPPWEGLDYALLANNINCLLCHTSIDNAERFYNNNPALIGTFDPVKLGSIESIHFRSDPNSTIAGQALIGGDAIMGDGRDINDWSRFNLLAATLSNGSLQEDGFGNLDYHNMRVFDPDDPDTNASLVLDYFAHQDEIDAELPGSFPSPFPDNGGYDPETGSPVAENAGNRIVDDEEFYATVGGASGTLSGGQISVVAKGDRISNEADREAMINGWDDSIGPITDGNVYLHGTETNPIILDGEVAIDGDVVLSGVVLGQGSIKARGNVYIPGDLVYADDGIRTPNRTYGTSADGRTNSLAVAAGGNIVVGDFYRPAWGKGEMTNGERSGSFNFTMDELAIFNRQEWIKTQPTLPGKWEKYQDGVRVHFEDEKVKEYYWKTVDRYKWVKTGKKIEVPRYKWIWVSNGLSGVYEVKTRKRVQDGWHWIDEEKRVTDGTQQVQKWRWKKTGRQIRVETPIYRWRQPQIDNPYYVENHLPRYYGFDDGTPIPIFNKDGYFDPASKHWMSDEYAGDWDDSKLSYARVDDEDDPFLYDASGAPKAVVETIAPTDGWITPEMMLETIEHGQRTSLSGSKTLEIDATLYSANSVLGTIPARESPNTNGKLLVNGGLVGADIGILAPEGTQVNFDGRGTRALSITSDNSLSVSRRLTAPLPRN